MDWVGSSGSFAAESPPSGEVPSSSEVATHAAAPAPPRTSRAATAASVALRKDIRAQASR